MGFVKLAAPGRTSRLFGLFIVLYLMLVATSTAGASARGHSGAPETQSFRSTVSNTETKSCFDIMKSCRHHKECREALVKLKTKCAVKAGSCNTNMRNLPTCAKIMDLLTNARFFNPDQKCSCNKKRGHCAAIHKKIYENPCFGSVRFLRSRNMLPKLDDIEKPNTVQSNLAAVSRESSDEVFEAFMTYNDYAADESVQLMTSPTPGTSQSESTTVVSVSGDVKNDESNDVIIPQTESGSINYVATKSETYVEDPFDQPTNTLPHNDAVLLHVVAIATGILLIVMVIAGAAMLFFVSMKRKECKNARKETMT
uniref:Uncharacterized LOC100184315 n=1 Tax=Ciona intestinalis TaxID=7719 RepID=F6ZFG7_CIOIN|nr:uncharacterized protein LOC100184315 [Ciona intestinalis]|eukprot:XP_026696354.1 uncharacterized protein LOC100184315 [Ciona intestinalis]